MSSNIHNTSYNYILQMPIFHSSPQAILEQCLLLPSNIPHQRLPCLSQGAHQALWFCYLFICTNTLNSHSITHQDWHHKDPVTTAQLNSSHPRRHQGASLSLFFVHAITVIPSLAPLSSALLVRPRGPLHHSSLPHSSHPQHTCLWWIVPFPTPIIVTTTYSKGSSL